MNSKDPVPSNEPSVWEYFVEKIKFWNKAQPTSEESALNDLTDQKKAFPWYSVLALCFALIAQLTFEPSPNRTPWIGLVIYFLSLSFLVVGIIKKEWVLPNHKPDAEKPIDLSFQLEFLLVGFFFSVFAFILFGKGTFGWLNTLLWILGIVFVFLAFLRGKPTRRINIKTLFASFKQKGWVIRFSSWGLVVLGVIAVILFFNFYRLDSVPPEMVSDQAEKLMDINDILNGYKPVYFPRNTGREGLHFYLTAAFIGLFDLSVSFLNLKIVAVFANLLTLFFIFLLGKELGGKRVGLWASLFAGMAYWPLLFTRLALRIPYYPLFVAPVMYFLIRGLRRQKISDVLWAGLFLGLGLHGYTPFRIVPIFVVMAVVIYLLHKPSQNRRWRAIFGLMLIAFVSLLVFIPLLRYWLANPDLFAYRAFSRLTGMEVGFAESPVVIFLKNFWRASVMFFWDNGTIWAHSVPNRPALEVVTAALYFLGIVSLLIRYVRRRNWIDLVLLVSIPAMLMPSILSLAYPAENPCLNRTAGAVVPVFVVVGLAFETLIRTLRKGFTGRFGKLAVMIIVLVLVIWSGANNFDLVFNQYYEIYRASSWNTSEIGGVAQLFIESIGSPETTYVVGYPHWIDSRLVAINSNQPGMDYAIFPEQIRSTTTNPKAKLFFVNVNDVESMALLQKIYPSGSLTRFDSEVEGKDFMMFLVPSAQGVTP